MSKFAQDFVELWESGKSDKAAQDKLQSILEECELAGRMIYGKADDPNFGKLLNKDEWKKLTFVFGPDALPLFLGKSPRQICLQLGFGEDWLDIKLGQGFLFKLCIFPSTSTSATMATWDGVENLLSEHHSEVWPKIEHHYKAIQSMTIDEIEELAGYDMNEANLAGRDPITGESPHDHYMSLQRLIKIEAPTLVQVRQFLWDEISLRKLYKGDGYTYDDNGDIGNKEYLSKNTMLDNIDGVTLVDVDPSKKKEDDAAFMFCCSAM